MGRGTWWATVHGVARVAQDFVMKPPTLVMLSIFPCASWSFIYLLWKNIYSNPLTVFEWICGVLYVALVVKKKKKTCLPMQETWVQSLVGKIPWRRACQPTPVFLPGESHGHRSLAGYIHWVAQSQTQLKRLSIHTGYSGYWSFVRHMVLKIFSLIMWVTFLLCWYYFLYTIFFMESSLSTYSFIACSFGIISKKSNPVSCKFCPMFFPNSFIISDFTFRSLIHFELVFV